MTDNDIIKALECCSRVDEGLYGGLTYKGEPLRILIKDALDLINRQKAEIERLNEKVEALGDPLEKAHYEISELKAEIERLQKAGEEAVSCFNRMESLYNIKCMELKVAKNQAITEFAERLKATPMRFHVEYVEYYDKPSIEKMVLFIDDNDIDQIAKEMKGEQE